MVGMLGGGGGGGGQGSSKVTWASKAWGGGGLVFPLSLCNGMCQ